MVKGKLLKCGAMTVDGQEVIGAVVGLTKEALEACDIPEQSTVVLVKIYENKAGAENG